MSAAHFEELLRNCPDGLSSTAWRVLAVACYRAREDGEIVESKSRLAEECGLSKPTITRAFTQLVKQKLLFCKDEKIFSYGENRGIFSSSNKSFNSRNKSCDSDALIKNTHTNECASGGAGAYERVRVVSSSANFIAARHLTDEQRRFIDAYGKRPRDYEAFTAEWERLCATVSPAQLTACATAAVEDLLKRGELQFLKKPENWLADNEHRQYLDRLPAVASVKSWDEAWATETQTLAAQWSEAFMVEAKKRCRKASRGNPALIAQAMEAVWPELKREFDE